MNEQSKAAKRRFFDGNFHNQYFTGNGIDIGGGPDSLAQYCGIFPAMTKVRTWDIQDGDAQSMLGTLDNLYNFVHSSHCLEHMRDVYEALRNWIRITKPGGFLIITVPDEDMYEQGKWPSRFNTDHKFTFTAFKTKSWSPISINVIDLVRDFADKVSLEKLQVLRDFYQYNLPGVDQTQTPNAECAIEFILRKHHK